MKWILTELDEADYDRWQAFAKKLNISLPEMVSLAVESAIEEEDGKD